MSTLSDVEKYQDLTKHSCPTNKSSLFQKSVQEGGEAKTLIYQLSWVQKNYWHDYSKKLQGGLRKTVLSFLFDDDDTRQLGKFVKTMFQGIGKSKKIKEHPLTKSQNKCWKSKTCYYRIRRPYKESYL